HTGVYRVNGARRCPLMVAGPVRWWKKPDDVLPRMTCYVMCLICDLSRIIVVAIKQRIDGRQGGIVRIRLILICAGNEKEKKYSVNYFVVFSGYGLYAT
ncbi:hypothetical protein, partial [Escherichia coli]|uniref:hypothetical protein n=1 Tax=Escherichia coli TaxID=562 RepID=UPI002023A5C3